MPLIKSTKPPVQPDAADPLSGLQDPSADVRRQAVRAAAQLPDATPVLGEALAREADQRVREAIFSSLAALATPDSLAVIVAYVRSDEAEVRTAALDALSSGARAAEPLLAGLLTDPDADVRLLACEIVRGLPSPVATRLMIRVLDSDPETNVCAAAVEVLAEVGDATAQPALNRCAERFAHEPFLVFSTRAAAQRLGVERG
jgi:HEAT repeat protein